MQLWSEKLVMEKSVERVLLATEREVDAAAWCRGGGGGGGGVFAAKTMEEKH